MAAEIRTADDEAVTGRLGLFATLIAQGAHARRKALQKAEQERRCDDERAAADRDLIERMPVLLTLTRVVISRPVINWIVESGCVQ